jgi:hypothetical protein
MAAGTDEYQICVRDLVEFRARIQQWLRDYNGGGLDY